MVGPLGGFKKTSKIMGSELVLKHRVLMGVFCLAFFTWPFLVFAFCLWSDALFLIDLSIDCFFIQNMIRYLSPH